MLITDPVTTVGQKMIRLTEKKHAGRKPFLERFATLPTVIVGRGLNSWGSHKKLGCVDKY